MLFFPECEMKNSLNEWVLPKKRMAYALQTRR
jgi:hypothetical protein